jgi:hypothetical protein
MYRDDSGHFVAKQKKRPQTRTKKNKASHEWLGYSTGFGTFRCKTEKETPDPHKKKTKHHMNGWGTVRDSGHFVAKQKKRPQTRTKKNKASHEWLGYSTGFGTFRCKTEKETPDPHKKKQSIT